MTTTVVSNDLSLTGAEVQRRLSIIGLVPEDSERVKSLRGVMEKHAQEFTDSFFAYLAAQEEGNALVRDPEALVRAGRLKKEHLHAMVKGEYGVDYVQERLELAVLYADAGLDPRLFLGAYRHLLRNIGNRIMQGSLDDPLEGFATFMSLMKVAFFDLSFIVDVIVIERERIILQQQEAIRDLSTPVLPVREGLLILPMIGAIDTERARQLTEHLLEAIREHRAKVVVIDITGVPSMDMDVANRLVQTVLAARLSGARLLISGLSAQVSQALLSLRVDVSTLDTFGDLRGAIEEAELALGYTIRKPALTGRAAS